MVNIRVSCKNNALNLIFGNNFCSLLDSQPSYSELIMIQINSNYLADTYVYSNKYYVIYKILILARNNLFNLSVHYFI